MRTKGMMPGTWDRFDIVAAYYWWLSDHYDGQWSKEYRRLCKLSRSYRPGMSERSPGPNPEGYDALCERAGCTHRRRCETCEETHIDYPHEPGYMLGCGPCEDHCHCGPGVAAGWHTECVWSEHQEPEEQEEQEEPGEDDRTLDDLDEDERKTKGWS